MEIKLGQLSEVELKRVWNHEALDFTPWMAANISLLGQALGLELEIEGTEKNVGPFRADILCREVLADHWVLIENQIEKTDHTHLGQVITYASGLDAATIIWVAREFTEEHRAAIDWLNNISGDDFNFFGLEIELWQIGDSQPAPRFNVVAKPNDWKRSVKNASKQFKSGELSELGQKRFAYWTSFQAFLEDSGADFELKTPPARGYVEFPIDIPGTVVAAYVSFASNAVGVFVRFLGHNAETYYNHLFSKKTIIEKDGELNLKWSETKPGHKYHIFSNWPIRTQSMNPREMNNSVGYWSIWTI